MPRYLRNRKTGIIRPWNEHTVSHPDLYEWDGDPLNPDPDPVAKAPVQKKQATRKKATSEVASEAAKKESSSLLKGLIGD